jgi:hypothetical protein
MQGLPQLAYITRNGPSWWVRFFRHREVIRQKSFPFRRYLDGKSEALFWAQQWRDAEYFELLEAGAILPYGCMIKGPAPPVMPLRAGNTAGVNGVFLKDYHRMNRGEPVHDWAWCATWRQAVETEEGVEIKTRVKSFSCYRYGYEKARRMAIRARKKTEKYLLSKRHQKLRQRAIGGPKLVKRKMRRE